MDLPIYPVLLSFCRSSEIIGIHGSIPLYLPLPSVTYLFSKRAKTSFCPPLNTIDQGGPGHGASKEIRFGLITKWPSRDESYATVRFLKHSQTNFALTFPFQNSSLSPTAISIHSRHVAKRSPETSLDEGSCTSKEQELLCKSRGSTLK